MIDDVGSLFSAVMQLFTLDFTLYGYTFSWWQVFAFSVVVGILVKIFWEVFR